MREIKQIIDNLKSAVWYEEGQDGYRGIISTKGNNLKFIFSYGGGWEHASVSLERRCPTWEEMCFVKNFFWRQNEVVIQYHPAKKDYVNQHQTCLHLWKPIDIDIPVPPKIFVGGTFEEGKQYYENKEDNI